MAPMINTVATKADLEDFSADLSKLISKTKISTIKWMFVFWIGQASAPLAVVLFCLKK